MTKNKQQILLLIIGVLTTPFVYAQDNSIIKKWTLQECVDYALDNNLSVERGFLNVESSDITLDQSKMALLPSVNANGSTGYNWGRSIDPTTNDFITQRIHAIGASAGANVTLFNGFALRNTITQNRLSYEGSKYSLEKTKNDITINVVLSFVVVIFNKELYENTKLQLASTQEQVTRTEKQVAVGALPNSALLDIQAQLASNEVNVINQENELNISKLKLKQLLQLPANEPFDVAVPDVNLNEINLQNTSVGEIYVQSQMVMPDIKIAEYNVQSADYGEKSAKAQFYPRITASAGLSTNYSDAFKLFNSDGSYTQEQIPDPENPLVMIDAYQQVKYSAVHGSDFYAPIVSPNGNLITKPISDQFNDNLSKYISLGVSIPIFNGMQARSNVQRATIARRQAEISKIETNNTLRQSIESAYNDVQAAAKSYQSSLKLVDAREESFRAVQKRSALNAISKYDYQIAENDLFRAKSDLLRAKYDYIVKLKILDFYQGKTLEF